MAAGKATYLIVWKKSSQVYSAATLKTAKQTPVPKGCDPEDKRVLLATYLPDEEKLCVYPVTEEQIEEKTSTIEDNSKDEQEESRADNDPA